MTIVDQLASLLKRPDEGELKALLEAEPEELDRLLELDMGRMLPQRPSSEQAEWASRVMQEVLARVDEAAGPARPEAFDDPRVHEAQEIGKAFAEGLAPAVRETEYSVRSFFAPLDGAQEPRWWTDLDDLSVDTASAPGRFLRRCGMSPLTVAAAAHGIANDLRRTYDLRALADDTVLTVTARPPSRPQWQTADPHSPIVAVEDLGRQVALVTGLDEGPGRRLGAWLFLTAHHRSRLFDGFVCQAEGEPLLCKPTQEAVPLPARWAHP